jgi:hypothetical protein
MHKIILFFILVSFSATAETYNSVADGDWNTSSTWDDGIPASNPTQSNDVINIMHSITLNGDLEVQSGTILNILGCDTLIINGDVIFKNNSVVNVASCAALIINGNVNNRNNSDQITIDGLIQITGNFTGGNKSILDGTGNMELGGALTLQGSGGNTAQVFGITQSCISGCNLGQIGSLPVELINFTAANTEQGVQLVWSTASETNCYYYEIQRSRDGYTFETIKTIEGSGTTADVSYYSYSDAHPIPGVSYYRLNQYDYDGTKNDLGIVSVQHEPTVEMKVYPNPVSQGNSLFLALKVDQNQIIQTKLQAINGSTKAVSHTFKLYKGSNSITLPSYDNLAPGVYFIEVIGDNIRQKLKFVVY